MKNLPKFAAQKKPPPLEKPQGRSTGPALPAPDLEGCVSTGQTREEIEKNMREAIEFQLEGLRLEGLRVFQPRSYSTYVEVPA